MFLVTVVNVGNFGDIIKKRLFTNEEEAVKVFKQYSEEILYEEGVETGGMNNTYLDKEDNDCLIDYTLTDEGMVLLEEIEAE